MQSSGTWQPARIVGSNIVRAVAFGACLLPLATAEASSLIFPPRTGPQAGAGVRYFSRSSKSEEEQRQARVSSQRVEELRDALAKVDFQLFPRGLTNTPSLGLGLTDSFIPSAGSSFDVPLVSWTSEPTAADRRSEWLEQLALPNFSTTLHPRTVRYLKFYRDSPRGRLLARAFARRAGRYSASIMAELRKAQLPTDLVWMSLVESGHNPTARSPAGAAGLWQFMPHSARAYGLTVDRWVDERLDPMRCTEAAIRLLSDLYERLGSWDLAMAGYNMGSAGVARAIRKYNTNDFWQLSGLEAALPWETALYVPKVTALGILMRNRSVFGVRVGSEHAVRFETVSAPAGVRLASLARQADVDEKLLAELNPHYLRAQTPPLPAPSGSGWLVRVPQGTSGRIKQSLAKLQPEAPPATVTVRYGDDLESVARRYAQSERSLRRLNGLTLHEQVHPGDQVQLARASTPRPRPDQEDLVVQGAGTPLDLLPNEVAYRVRDGDTLHSVAAAFGTTTQELLLTNSVTPEARLIEGMTLRIVPGRKPNPERVRFVDARDVATQVRAGSERFFDLFEDQKGRSRLVVHAREGDTLARIGRRYSLSPGMMERINHRRRDSELSEGQRVVVYSRGGALPFERVWSSLGQPLPPVRAPYPDLLPLSPISTANP